MGVCDGAEPVFQEASHCARDPRAKGVPDLVPDVGKLAEVVPHPDDAVRHVTDLVADLIERFGRLCHALDVVLNSNQRPDLLVELPQHDDAAAGDRHEDRKSHRADYRLRPHQPRRSPRLPAGDRRPPPPTATATAPASPGPGGFALATGAAILAR